jgi:thiosulfate/3-mercaptopyruvate sulfurtransferase
MTYATLVDARTLAAHASDPDWRIVDCRFDLGNPDAGSAAFQRGHIPGAVYAHLDRDLSGPRTPWSGRHPLPEPEALAATLGELGVDAGVQVVAYDDAGGMYAARLWWLLRWLGHRGVAVLDGGLAAWRASGAALGIRAPSGAASSVASQIRTCR